MKKLFYSALLFLGVAAFATPVSYLPASTSNKPIPAVGIKGESYLLMDALLSPGDVYVGRMMDVLQIPSVMRDTQAVLYNTDAGYFLYSCYHPSDSGGVTDTTDVSFQAQYSKYATDNTDPNSAFSQAFRPLGSAVVIDKAADAHILLDTVFAVALSARNDRFLRVQATNSSATPGVMDVTRCRVYWTRKSLH